MHFFSSFFSLNLPLSLFGLVMAYLTISITSPFGFAPHPVHLGGGGGVTPNQAPTQPTTSLPQIEQLPILCSIRPPYASWFPLFFTTGTLHNRITKSIIKLHHGSFILMPMLLTLRHGSSSFLPIVLNKFYAKQPIKPVSYVLPS